MAHFIAVRGDTFKVVAAGSCGAIEKRCEATVQRFPEFVDPGGNAPGDKILSAVNGTLGRRFAVVLFRWINAREWKAPARR
jgi:hypothetical protein